MSTAQQRLSPHLPVRTQWLALHSEPALEPGLAIIDVIWNALKRITAGVGADERKALFPRTAAGVYGIDLTGTGGKK